MHRGTFLIFFSTMVMLIIFALLTQALVIIPRIAAAVTINGRVEVQRSGQGEFLALTQGSPVKTGDVVRTGPNSEAEFRWADGTRWKLAPNTQLVIKRAVHNMLKRADDSELELSSGKVFVRIIKALTEASRFEVATPTAVAAVRGTIFSVEYTNGHTQVAVYKGHVKVSSGDGGNSEEQMIEPGQAAESDRPGSVNTVASAAADSAFQAEPTIIKPELGNVSVRALSNGRALVSGATEAGDTVTINGKRAVVLGNGFFEGRTDTTRGDNSIIVVTTDKHGETTQIVKTFVFPTPAAHAAQ